jgi:hypothetical protein
MALRFGSTPRHSTTLCPRCVSGQALCQHKNRLHGERQPIAYPTLSAVQQRLFWDAVEHALTNPTISTGDLLLNLDRLYEPESQESLALYLDFWKNFSFEVSTTQVKLVFEDVEDYQKTLQEFAASGVSVSVKSVSDTVILSISGSRFARRRIMLFRGNLRARNRLRRCSLTVDLSASGLRQYRHRRGAACPAFKRQRALMHEHAQPVDGRQPACGGCLQQARLQRAVH